MLKNTDLTRFIINLLPESIKGKVSGSTHRTLLAFNAACLHDFIIRAKKLDEGTMTALLPALLDPMQSKTASREAIVSLLTISVVPIC